MLAFPGFQLSKNIDSSDFTKASRTLFSNGNRARRWKQTVFTITNEKRGDYLDRASDLPVSKCQLKMSRKHFELSGICGVRHLDKNEDYNNDNDNNNNNNNNSNNNNNNDIEND